MWRVCWLHKRVGGHGQTFGIHLTSQTDQKNRHIRSSLSSRFYWPIGLLSGPGPSGFILPAVLLGGKNITASSSPPMLFPKSERTPAGILFRPCILQPIPLFSGGIFSAPRVGLEDWATASGSLEVGGGAVRRGGGGDGRGRRERASSRPCHIRGHTVASVLVHLCFSSWNNQERNGAVAGLGKTTVHWNLLVPYCSSA